MIDNWYYKTGKSKTWLHKNSVNYAYQRLNNNLKIRTKKLTSMIKPIYVYLISEQFINVILELFKNITVIISKVNH